MLKDSYAAPMIGAGLMIGVLLAGLYVLVGAPADPARLPLPVVDVCQVDAPPVPCKGAF